MNWKNVDYVLQKLVSTYLLNSLNDTRGHKVPFKKWPEIQTDLSKKTNVTWTYILHMCWNTHHMKDNQILV